jgi:predicted  nucleic acid-binding Zn-ribbon protein
MGGAIMELKDIDKKLQDILDKITNLNVSLQSLEDQMSDIEMQITSDVDGMLDNVRSNIGDDIQSAVSEINSNTDQLKD